MYVVVIAILSLVLAFPVPPARLIREPGWVLAAVVAATLLPLAASLWFARRTLRALDERPDDPGRAQAQYARGMTLAQMLLALGHGFVLTMTRWTPMCGRVPVAGDWPVVPGLLAATPFLLSVVLVWVGAYPADRAIRQVALESQLFRGRPVHPVWSLREFVAFNFRHQVLFILLPMALILAARDVIDLAQPSLRRVSTHPFLPDLLLGLVACVVAVIAPWILRHVWHVQPLPPGPLRDQLDALCAALRMRCREILVWRSGGMVVNAAVMGVVAPLRYVLISDAMLEQLEDQKIEAVFGHEAGHVKQHHILFFLLFAFTSGCLITITSVYARGQDRMTQQWLIALVGALLLVKWGVLFGMISRRFERQADLYGARTLALSGMPCTNACALHVDASAPPRREALRGPICQSAANVFSETLNDVAHLNGIPPDAPSWRHGSIASRSTTLQLYARQPAASRRFEHGVRRLKLVIVLAALASGVWAACVLKIWLLLSPAGW